MQNAIVKRTDGQVVEIDVAPADVQLEAEALNDCTLWMPITSKTNESVYWTDYGACAAVLWRGIICGVIEVDCWRISSSSRNAYWCGCCDWRGCPRDGKEQRWDPQRVISTTPSRSGESAAKRRRAPKETVDWLHRSFKRSCLGVWCRRWRRHRRVHCHCTCFAQT